MAKYGFEAEWEKITPKKAYSFLETMGDSNRDVRQSVIDDYASQMKAGLWRRNPQPIIFDKQGVMVDGQHRCWAVIESQTEIDAFVVHGMDRDDVTTVDHGIPRSYKDVAHYQGWNSDPMTASIAKYMVLQVGTANQRVPAEIVHTWYESYQASVDFAIELRLKCRPSRGKGITLPMAAAIARAHAAGSDPALLTRFGEILKHGQVDMAADNAAFVLRDAWLQRRLGETNADQYFKTEAALRAFLDRRSIKTLQRSSGEIFAIKNLPMKDRYTVLHSRKSPRAGEDARRKFEQKQIAA